MTRKKTKHLFLILCIGMLISCNTRHNEKSVLLQPIISKPLLKHVIILDEEKKEELRSNNPFTIVFLNTGDSGVTFAITKSKNLVCYRSHFPFDKKDRTTLKTLTSDMVMLNAHKNFLYTYDYITKNCEELIIFKDSLRPVDSAILGNFLRSKEYFYMDEQNNKIFRTDQGLTLAGNYGLWKKKNRNYLDTGLFIMSFHDKTSKIFKYPEELYDNYTNNRKSFFAIDDSLNWYFAFEDGIHLYKGNTNGEIFKQAVCNYYSVATYDASQKKDLSYARKYNAENECNKDMRLINGHYLVLLKKLPQKTVSEPETSFFNVYDTNLKLLFSDSLTGKIFPRIFERKGGFYFIETDLSKLTDISLPK